MFRGSRHKAEAWKLIEFLSRPDQQLRFYQLCGDLPARTEAWRDTALTNDRVCARVRDAAAARGVARPEVPEWESISLRIQDAAEAMVLAHADPDSTLARARPRRGDAISRSAAGWWPRAHAVQPRSGHERARSGSRESRAGWLFSGAGAGADRRVLLRAGGRRSAAQLHRLRHLRDRRPGYSALGRPRQLLAGARPRRCSGRRSATRCCFVLVGGPLSVLTSLVAALLVSGRRVRAPGPLPLDLLHPGRDHAGGGGDRVALPLPPALRAGERGAGRASPADRGLARRSALGHAGDHPDDGVEELRLQHADLHRRPADHPRGPATKRRSWTARTPGRASCTSRCPGSRPRSCSSASPPCSATSSCSRSRT